MNTTENTTAKKLLPTIRVLLVDDHKLFREGLVQLFYDEPSVKLTASPNAEDALALLNTEKFDMILIDINMPGMNGIELCKAIRQQHSDIKILGVSSHTEQEYIKQMVGVGANGYLIKSAGKQELMTAIQTLMRGEFYFTPDVALAMMGKLVAERVGANVENPLAALSRREKEIIVLIAQEFTTAEIAGKLFISPGTVDFHRKNILRKTGARNSAGIAVFAAKHGLV